MEKNRCIIEVRFSEVDSLKIAHNSKYYVWFEIGRFSFAKEVLSLDKCYLLDKYALPVVRSSCKYLSPIHFGDVLLLDTYIYIQNTGKILFYYYLRNGNGKLCAIGSTRHVMLDQKGALMRSYDKEISDIFERKRSDMPLFFLNGETAQKAEERINR